MLMHGLVCLIISTYFLSVVVFLVMKPILSRTPYTPSIHFFAYTYLKMLRPLFDDKSAYGVRRIYTDISISKCLCLVPVSSGFIAIGMGLGHRFAVRRSWLWP